MEFKIPFTFGKIETLKRKSNYLLKYLKFKKKLKLREILEGCYLKVSAEEYIAICLRNLLINSIILASIIEIIFFAAGFFGMLIIGPLIAVAITFFIFIIQINYPKMNLQKRQRNIEKNLISALQDISVQLDSGMPLFDSLINISNADYGELSLEFKKAVRKIKSGTPEETVLEELSKNNPSVFFRRTLWQISNGMNVGSDISMIILESIKSLSQEQTIQIEKYGSSLNPIIVFYMLVGVIIPSLSVTFLTVIASVVGLSGNILYILFTVLFVFVMFTQIMFLGLIKSRRPSLLSN